MLVEEERFWEDESLRKIVPRRGEVPLQVFGESVLVINLLVLTHPQLDRIIRPRRGYARVLLYP